MDLTEQEVALSCAERPSSTARSTGPAGRPAPTGRPPRPIQVSLDSDRPDVNDAARGPDNFDKVVEAIPRLVDMGLRVRVATTLEGPADPDASARQCELHRSLGVADEDHVVRPVVRRGRARVRGAGVDVESADLPAELTITADGAFWSPFGPTVAGGVLDTDLLVTRTTDPLDSRRGTAAPRPGAPTGRRRPPWHPLSVRAAPAGRPVSSQVNQGPRPSERATSGGCPRSGPTPSRPRPVRRWRAMTPARSSRRLLGAAAVATSALLVAACGGSSPSGQPPPPSASTLPSLEDAGPAPVAPPTTVAPSAADASVLPDIVVDDVGGGRVNLASLAPSAEPILLWMWAPH